MSDRPITDYDKLRCAEREVSMRRSVYPGRVRNGLMTRGAAEREIELMAAIAADYRAKVMPDMLPRE